MPRPNLLQRSYVLLVVMAAAAATASATACVPLPGGREVSRHTVVRKEAENTLVSEDNATCRVKGDTYEKVSIGDQHTCVWEYADADRPRTPSGADPSPRRAPGRPSGNR